MTANPFRSIPEPLDIPARPRARYEREYSGDPTDSLPTGSSTLKSPHPRSRTIILLALLGLTVLFGRAAYLQLAHGAEYRVAAERHRLKLETVQASRGIIADRNGEPLLSNVPNYRLTVEPFNLPDGEVERTRILERLSAMTGEAVESIAEAVRNHRTAEPLVLREHLTGDEALGVIVEAARLPGVNVDIEPVRSYRFGDAFSHLIGYVGAATETDVAADPSRADAAVGRTGLEASYDDVLRGAPGVREIERDTHGKTLKFIASRDPVPGKNLTLTVDARLQRAAQERLDAMVKNRRSTGGALVAIDPRSGEVLALTSSPSFDPNAFVTGLAPEALTKLLSDPRRPLFNRAIAGAYPSGSTIKPVIAAAALAEGVITPTSTVVSTGGLRIDKWFFPDWKAGGHGVTDVRKALAESVNTFFYIAAGGYDDRSGLGVDRIRQYAERFGLNRQLGIDLPGEVPGFLPTKAWKEKTKGEPWYIGDTYHLAIGQGDLLVTPLQVASYTAAIANGGTLYRPMLVRKVADPDGNVLSMNSPRPLGSVGVSDSLLQVVREGLRTAVTSGSAVRLAGFPVAVAGKTGTAEFGNEGKTHAWFTAFAPYDEPEIAVAVVVEGGGEGHEAALPVAEDFLRVWIEERSLGRLAPQPE